MGRGGDRLLLLVVVLVVLLVVVLLLPSADAAKPPGLPPKANKSSPPPCRILYSFDSYSSCGWRALMDSCGWLARAGGTELVQTEDDDCCAAGLSLPLRLRATARRKTRQVSRGGPRLSPRVPRRLHSLRTR